MGYKILVADDEPEIRDILHLYLENAGYDIIEAEDGLATLTALEKNNVDLLILDIMMPKIDGFHVLKKIRETSNIPVIVLSAKNEDANKILGLDLGADDYITKPFQPLEMIARVNSNIRRFYSLGAGQIQGSKTKSIELRNLVLDTESCLLKIDGEPVDLTSVEYRIVKMFMENPGKVFTKQQIYEHGWEDDFYTDDNNIMVCISKLRSKLSDDQNKYIKTIRGLGYRLEA